MNPFAFGYGWNKAQGAENTLRILEQMVKERKHEKR
jgi:hypothetical protein